MPIFMGFNHKGFVMSDDTPNVVNELKGRLSNAASERMKDGFYGYLLTAFAIGNWQNIFILFKSKKPIEETIQHLTSQPDFITHSLTIPLVLGILAAFILPWLVTLYALLLAMSRSYIKSSERAAEAARALQLSSIELKAQLQRNQASTLADTLEENQKELQNLKDEIRNYQETKESYDKFFRAVEGVFIRLPEMKTEDDFKLFFVLAKERGVFDYYSESSLAVNFKHGAFKEVIEGIIEAREQSSDTTSQM